MDSCPLARTDNVHSVNNKKWETTQMGLYYYQFGSTRQGGNRETADPIKL